MGELVGPKTLDLHWKKNASNLYLTKLLLLFSQALFIHQQPTTNNQQQIQKLARIITSSPA